jgi:D-glycero-D-manno-heptose 1,7-bisphosphate phosphatase
MESVPLDMSLPFRFRRSRASVMEKIMRPALFLDRDGIINIDRDYVYRIEDFEWQPGIFDLVRIACAAGMPTVIVTNQSGIGRGLYSERDFQVLTDHMRTRFAHEGAPIAAVYHCPFHPDAAIPELRAPDHPWRKPNPGMLFAARDELGLDLSASTLVGDRGSDMAAGRSAGVGRLILVSDTATHVTATTERPTLSFATVADATLWLAREGILIRSK